jgi:uncharacterized protein (TIGR02284 family)
MPNPSKDLQEAESTLRSVIQSLIDGQEDLRNIGEQVKDASLKEYFLAESLTRAHFRGVLESILHQEGVHDVRESGTATATLQRLWGDLKTTLGGGDQALLATAEEIEKEAVDAYSKATDANLPLPVRQILASQAAHIESSLEFIRSARDAKK